MGDRTWYTSLSGHGYPMAFHKVFDGTPVRIWTRVNSPSAPWKPNLNLPKFDSVEDAEKWMDFNYARYDE